MFLAGLGEGSRRQRRQRLGLVGWLIFVVLCAAIIVGGWAWIVFFAACIVVGIGLLAYRLSSKTANASPLPVTSTGRLDATSATTSDEQRRQVHENRRRARQQRAP